MKVWYLSENERIERAELYTDDDEYLCLRERRKGESEKAFRESVEKLAGDIGFARAEAGEVH